jgi:rare lipoprotein A
MKLKTKIIIGTITMIFLLLFFGCYTIGELKPETRNDSDSSTVLLNDTTLLQDHDSTTTTTENINKIDTVYKPLIGGGASWYGSNGVPGIKHTDDYHGKKSASGVRFDTHTRMAAHKTLPFGTLVRVTNVKNNLSTIVEIVDRGPYAKGRVIDLSWYSKNKIEMAPTGVVKLEQVILYKNGKEIVPDDLYCPRKLK